MTMLYKDGRIKGVQDTLDGAVAAGLITNPWRVTSLPTVGTGNLMTPTTMVQCLGASSTTLSTTALTTIADITGSGYLDFCSIQAVAAVSSTMRVKITVDGTVIVDFTSPAASTAYRTYVIYGEYASGSEYLCGGPPIYFRSGLTVEAQQSGATNARCQVRYVLAAPYAA